MTFYKNKIFYLDDVVSILYKIWFESFLIMHHDSLKEYCIKKVINTYFRISIFYMQLKVFILEKNINLYLMIDIKNFIDDSYDVIDD